MELTEKERAESDAIDAVDLSAEDEAQIDRAIANARDPYDHEVAVAASFDDQLRILLLQLKTGQRLAIPQEDLQGISEAAPADLVEVEILGPGTTIHFEKAMEGFRVDDLRRGLYGSERWMKRLEARRCGHREKVLAGASQDAAAGPS